MKIVNPKVAASPPRATVKRSKVLYDRAMAIRVRVVTDFDELGGIFWEMCEKEYFRDYLDKSGNPYDSWHRFSSEDGLFESLDLKWRKADYLKSIHGKLAVELEIPREEYREIGWSKTKEIVPVVTKKNVKHWLKTAAEPGMTTAKLHAKVREAQGKITHEEAVKVPKRMTFVIYEEQERTIHDALAHVGKATGSDKPGYQLELLCIDYLSGVEETNGIPKARMVEQLLKRIAASYRVEIEEVHDLDTGETICAKVRP